MTRVVFLKSRAGFHGGLEKYTRHLLKAFVDKGCSVTLLTTGKPFEIPGVATYSLCPDSKFSFFQLLRFNFLCLRWLKKYPHDIVFGVERTTGQTHYRAGSGVHAVYLKRRMLLDGFFKKISLHLNPLHHLILSLEKKAFEEPSLKMLFTNSEMVRSEILNHYKTKPKKIHVVHNGVSWQEWQEPFEKSLTLPSSSTFRFLFVGNGYRRKGLLFLLRGLSLLSHKNFHLTVIGQEKEPHFFKNEVKNAGLSEMVTFLGAQEHLLYHYSRADALVIPSLYDPFANVTVEALAMGLFVVSSAFNGGKEVLTEQNGTVIGELTDPKSVAKSLELAMDHPKTEESARLIRESIKHLDFSSQLDKIVSASLKK